MCVFWVVNGSQYSVCLQDVGGNVMMLLEEDYVVSEDIFVSYVMGIWDVGVLCIIGGVCVENICFKVVGNQVDVVVNGCSFIVVLCVVNSSYINVLLGLYLCYDVVDDWVLCVLVNKIVLCLFFGDVLLCVGYSRGDEEVCLGNLELDLYELKNIDLLVEKYIGSSGIVLLGLFYKLIDGYIVEIVCINDLVYGGFDVMQLINGCKVIVCGVEFNWQQQLVFLLDGLDGLLVGVSGIWLDMKFDVGIEDCVGEDFILLCVFRYVYSVYIGYEKYGLSMCLVVVYCSEYLDSIGKGCVFDIYVVFNIQFDFLFDYKFILCVSVYFEVQNLLDKLLEFYQGICLCILQMEEYGCIYVLGLKVVL